MSQTKITQKIEHLPKNARILDAGGWFKPFAHATHVVDLMPWETRGATLQLNHLPYEKFTKETWYQIDFLSPNLRLPFEDKYFDFSICSHTLEDLEQPINLIQELIRVSRAGYIEVPSRLHEQTIGVANAHSSELGHSHHHYIVDQEKNELIFYEKQDSLNNSISTCGIPLVLYRKITAKNPELAILPFFWESNFKVRFESGSKANSKAREFRQSLLISWQDILNDKMRRVGRRAHKSLLGNRSQSTSDWWKEIVELSQPYSSILLT
jgi:SAM-dependent methyltransferase